MKKHVLIIEDDHNLADTLEDILIMDDYEVTVTHSGHNGLETALQTHPDLIILDIKMPDMNGYQVYERLQADAWGKQAKVLVLTASESLENIAKNINLPRNYVLFKPEVSVEALREIVATRITD
tara:strand:- start:25 stop:396 length:372 start_codon:yes stop_codon:yes gene_type:complete